MHTVSLTVGSDCKTAKGIISWYSYQVQVLMKRLNRITQLASVDCQARVPGQALYKHTKPHMTGVKQRK
jgi:hypothetical protein